MKNPRFISKYSSQRGFVTDHKTGEQHRGDSQLETEFLTLLVFLIGSEVKSIKDHPFDIEYKNPNGRWVKYPPDVHIVTTRASSTGEMNIIIEVKSKSNLYPTYARYEKILEHAHEGMKYARDKGSDWTYLIFTEREIWVPLLRSVEFLENYAADFYKDAKVAREIEEAVTWSPGITIKQLEKDFGSKSLHTVYHLFYHHILEFDYRIDLRPERKRYDASVYPPSRKPLGYFDLIEPLDIEVWSK